MLTKNAYKIRILLHFERYPVISYFPIHFHLDTWLLIKSVIHLNTIHIVKKTGNGGDARDIGKFVSFISQIFTKFQRLMIIIFVNLL